MLGLENGIKVQIVRRLFFAGIVVGCVVFAGSAFAAPDYKLTTLNHPDPTASGTRAYAVNASGTVVGAGFVPAQGDRAVRWSGGGATELGTLGMNLQGFANANAYAINSGGTIVGTGFRFDGY